MADIISHPTAAKASVIAKDLTVKIYKILDSPFALLGTKYDFPIYFLLFIH